MQLRLGLLLLAALPEFAAAQKNHGKQSVPCKTTKNSVLGVGGECHCKRRFKKKTVGTTITCEQKGAFEPEPECPPGKECGAMCFDGKDNDGDGKADCEDKDCQFDKAARHYCKDMNKGFGEECSILAPGAKALDELKRIERYCCPGGDCEKTPDRCSRSCSRVFVPFWASCQKAFHATGTGDAAHLGGLDALFPLCQKAEAPSGLLDEEVAECDYGGYLSVMLDCADQSKEESQVLFGNDRFCRSRCFEQAHTFSEKCKDHMTKDMTEGLSTILPYLSGCEKMVVRDPNSKFSKVKCDVNLENTIIAQDCGGITDGNAMLCENKCSKTLRQMSNKCSAEPEFTKYEAVQKRCRAHHADKRCRGAAKHFTKIFQHNCCGKDECAHGLPATCSSPCANSFMPYFSRCGSANFGSQLKQYGDMKKFSSRCAETKGRGHGGGVPDDSKDDPCSATTDCAKCTGKCGWCRFEANHKQLTGKDKKGWCGSQCKTTKGECGRGVKIAPPPSPSPTPGGH